MASTAENLIFHLTSDADIAALVNNRVHHNVVPEEPLCPFIWLQRRTTDNGEFPREGYAKPLHEYFDVEVVSDDLDEATELAGYVEDRLNEHTGEFGEDRVAWIEAGDQADDYVVRNQSADEHLTIQTFNVEITNP